MANQRQKRPIPQNIPLAEPEPALEQPVEPPMKRYRSLILTLPTSTRCRAAQNSGPMLTQLLEASRVQNQLLSDLNGSVTALASALLAAQLER